MKTFPPRSLLILDYSCPLLECGVLAERREPLRIMFGTMRSMLQHHRSSLAFAAATASVAATIQLPECHSRKCDAPSEMAAAVQELHKRVGQLSGHGWQRLLHAYGSADMCLAGHIRASMHKGQIDVTTAAKRIEATLAFREERLLNRPHVLRDIESARCRSYWPFAFAEAAPDGSPVEICRLSRLSVPRILNTFDEDEVVHFFELWCEHTVRMIGASIRAGASPRGSYHVYECTDVSWSQLVLDARRHWTTVARVFGVGGTHWPDIAAHYYVINAPYAACLLWKIIMPLAGDYVKHKVTISRGIPSELVEAVGGEAAFERMLHCSPHIDRLKL